MTKSFFLSAAFMAVNMQFASAAPPDVIDSHKLLYESSILLGTIFTT